MVTEIAYLAIDPGNADAFEEAVRKAIPVFAGASGCRAMRLERVHEDEAQYRLVVEWDSVEHHMVTFRQTPAFEEWRALAGPFFVAPPRVEHWRRVPGFSAE
ncbi:antibiotic biosynthesis monooxygenase [Erythrobacter arachoides]|uniref:Antibiotic biosynthesis monooxygenase n=1 Tax=Aurantiacibacter arachoides TaxID=1850444 RepID=A0A845A0H0_9SPHN|nr:antibiotic biosynthesis monooxygenase family protein [Aurantiacibacter arachoides]MXO92636.1 antibiotic biosynthesis monooxygenase [Aurantiacibacter arachoides]GGD55567.1 hypothetical protein GCM10011411_14510 [Aurantiacibacter arachoides]